MGQVWFYAQVIWAALSFAIQVFQLIFHTGIKSGMVPSTQILSAEEMQQFNTSQQFDDSN